jgi:hypothetical protein
MLRMPQRAFYGTSSNVAFLCPLRNGQSQGSTASVTGNTRMKQKERTPIICAFETGRNLIYSLFFYGASARFQAMATPLSGFETTQVLWGKSSAPNLEGCCSSLVPHFDQKLSGMYGPYLQLGCHRNSVPVQYCTQAPSHGEERLPQRGDTNQEDLGFSNWCVTKPHQFPF